MGAPLEEFPLEAVDKLININVKAVFELTHQCLPLLRASASAPDPARMIVTSWVDGIVAPTEANFAYSASKTGAIQLARHIAKVLASEHITVNSLAPGPFDSKMMAFALDDPEACASIAKSVPLKRVGEPEDMAGVVIYLCSKAGAYVTRQTLAVNGGLLLGSG